MNLHLLIDAEDMNYSGNYIFLLCHIGSVIPISDKSDKSR